MTLRLIPKDEISDRIISRTVKESIENIRMRRKYYSKCSSENQKKKAACRNNNLDPNGSIGIGFITETLVAKKLGIKTCFDITGNFNHPGYDMLEHNDWGMINSKGSLLSYSGNTVHHYFSTHKNKKPTFFFCIGFDYEMKDVISVYIIPNCNYVSTLNGIMIPYDSNSKWDKFKGSEEEINKWNDLFHILKLKNCKVLKVRQSEKT